MTTPAVPQVTLIKARSRKALVARPPVALLAKLAGELEILKAAFKDPIDSAALRDAVRLMHDVALSHDDAGGYGVYAIETIDIGEVQPC